MSNDQHIIKRISLELQMQSSAESYSLQRRCSNLVKRNLAPRLDGIFETWFPGDTITKIKKVEIDIGTLAAADLDKVFIERCLQQLSEQFRAIKFQQKSPAENGIEQFEPEQNALGQFFYFLRTGRLPWPAPQAFFHEWEEQLVNVIINRKVNFKTSFATLVTHHPSVIERLVLQFDISFIKKLLNIYEPPQKKGIVDLMSQVPGFIEKLVKRFDDGFIKELLYAYEPLLEKEINELMLMSRKVGLQNPSLQIQEKILVALLNALNKTHGSKMVSVVQMINKWLGRQSSDLIAQQFSPQSEQALELVLKELGLDFSTVEAKEFQKEVLNAKENLNKKIIEKKEALKEEAKETAVFIDNAGLVILHPFLNSLFEKTGLLHNNNFINDEAKCRAVHLLQYMVTAQEQLPEYLMPLNKILCGVPDEMHIDRFIELRQEEKKEADGLLQAVIEHWAALKNSSAEALQETFLQRRGKLSFIEEDHFWKLQVDRKGVDMLLDKLPWGYSYLQLPWMKHPLATEW